MANQSESVSFQRLLKSALLQYEKKTGVTLSEHPLALQHQSCNSVKDFNKLLQDKAKDVRESKRITKSMKTVGSILTPLASVASLPDAVCNGVVLMLHGSLSSTAPTRRPHLHRRSSSPRRHESRALPRSFGRIALLYGYYHVVHGTLHCAHLMALLLLTLFLTTIPGYRYGFDDILGQGDTALSQPLHTDAVPIS